MHLRLSEFISFTVWNKSIDRYMRWIERNRAFLEARSSPLQFYLHRSQYIRLLLATHPPSVPAALAYARANFKPFYHRYDVEINRLMSCIIYLPISRLQASPYADLASPTLHLDLEPMFAKEYCASLGMSRQVPLRVVGDIGGGGALARIEKGRKVMRERKSEWSQADELPVRANKKPPLRYCSNIFHMLLHRSRYLCQLRTGTIRCLPVPFQRSSPQNGIRP